MSCELRWSQSVLATCLHAALCRLERLYAVDAAVADQLGPPADRLLQEASSLVDDPSELLVHLASLAAEYDSNREIAMRALARTRGFDAGNERAVTCLAGAIGDLNAALQGVTPHLAADLEVRGRPLREQWEAYGPGLLRSVGRLTHENVVPEAASVVFVAPYAGGHGRAHLPTNRVLMEAVLYHPAPALPETLRLGWLLSQLNIDLPMFSDMLPPGSLIQVAQVAMAMATLASAQELELAVLDRSSLELALSTWRMGLPSHASEQLLGWWNAYDPQRDRWSVALAALASLLAEI
ncbi:MAG: hypothetical protein KDA61_07260 [Planctomycetales bacterium]|nr:hypothetical protein [Planctomycetales bacterium]